MLIFSLSSFSADIAIGTYTGNGGTAFDVTGLGFTPVAVMVQRGGGTSTNFIATSTMAGQVKLNGTGALVSNYITALGSGTFTVGTSTDANAAGVTYYYTAFSSAAVTTGTFVGDNGGDQLITTNFEPTMVWAMPGFSDYPSTSQMNIVGYETNSFKMIGGSADFGTDVLGVYTATQFTVKSTARNGSTFHYVAFSTGTTGTYTGTAVPRTISTGVGTKPKFLIAKDQGAAPGATHWYKTSSMPATSSYRMNGASATTQITGLTDDGFTYGTSTDANLSGSNNQYFMITEAQVLPVELLSFTGKKDGSSNLLIWETASEINSSHFIIERSEDGKNFSSIGRVGAAGNSSTLKKYSFIDSDVEGKVYYYRLLQVDFDGVSEYSNIISIGDLNNQFELNIFPNPFNDIITINTEENQQILNAELLIFNSVGQIVFQKAYENLGDTSININTGDWSRGVYYVTVTNNNDYKVTKKLIK